MISACANPECCVPLLCGKGRFFRFHKAYPLGAKPPNTHAVQHFWLCGVCSAEYTLAYEDRKGVVMLRRPDAPGQAMPCRFVAAA